MAPYDSMVPERRTRRTLLGLLIGGVVGLLLLLYALVVFAFGEAPEWTSATSVCIQPESIVYEQGFSFSVFVRKPSLSLSLSPGVDAVARRDRAAIC